MVNTGHIALAQRRNMLDFGHLLFSNLFPVFAHNMTSVAFYRLLWFGCLAGIKRRNGIREGCLALVACHHHILQQLLLLLHAQAYKRAQVHRLLPLQWFWHVLYVLITLGLYSCFWLCSRDSQKCRIPVLNCLFIWNSLQDHYCSSSTKVSMLLKMISENERQFSHCSSSWITTSQCFLLKRIRNREEIFSQISNFL